MNTQEAAQILGVPTGADEDAVKAAYRAKAIQLHPDTGGGHEAMVQLNQAYELLSGGGVRVAPAWMNTNSPQWHDWNVYEYTYDKGVTQQTAEDIKVAIDALNPGSRVAFNLLVDLAITLFRVSRDQAVIIVASQMMHMGKMGKTVKAAAGSDAQPSHDQEKWGRT